MDNDTTSAPPGAFRESTTGDLVSAKQPATDRPALLRVDREGYVLAGSVKLCRLSREQGVLLFHDKDRRRSARRGSDEIIVKVDDLAKLVGGGQ